MWLDKIERLKELTEQLNHYRDAYYNNSESLISDKQYDDLYDELQLLEKETGIDSERGKVASVFVNRLKRKMRLQSDPTVVYAFTKGNVDLEIENKKKNKIVTPHNISFYKDCIYLTGYSKTDKDLRTYNLNEIKIK